MKVDAYAPHPRLSTRLGVAFIGLCFLVPFLFAALNHFEGFAFATESLAYRWGHPSRASMGDIPAILPQGFTILAAQQYLVLAIEYFYPLTDETLRQSLQLFTWGTFLIFIASFLSILTGAARNPRLNIGQVCLIFLPWIAAIYATGSIGWYFCLLPDYYHLNAIIACAVALLCFPFIQAILDPVEPLPSPMQVIGLGAVLGLGVANKVTWGAPCLVVFGLVLLAGPARPLQALRRGALLAATAGLTLVLVLFAYYRFKPGLLLPGVREWFAFMHGQQGSIPMWGLEFRRMLGNFNYDWLYPLQMLTAAVAVVFSRGWRSRSVAFLCLAGMTALMWAVTQRPEGSTLWDINVLTLLLASLATMLLGRTWAGRSLITLWVLALALLCLRNLPTQRFPAIRGSAAASTNRFAVFQEVTRFADNRPQLIVFVNNEYHHNGLHELLLKAAADFPTWKVSAGQKWLQRFGADLTFLNEYMAPIELPTDLSGLCVVWFDLPELPLLTTRFARLAQLARDPSYEIITLPVYTVRQTSPPTVRVWVHAARLRQGPAFQSSFNQSAAASPLPAEKQ